MTRRAAGGSVFERKGAGPATRWEGRYSVALDGRRVQRSVYAATRREVLAKLDAARASHRSGGADDRFAPPPSVSGPTTVAGWLEQWLADQATRVRPSTLRRYADIVQHHLVPDLGNLTLRGLTVRHVERFLADCLHAGAAPRSVAHFRAVLRNALNDAMRNELVTRNVADVAEGPSIPAPERREWTAADVAAVLQAVEGTDEQGPAAVALLAGLRLAEALGLRWGDIDFGRRTIHVRHTMQRLNGGFVTGEPKSATSRRDVPMGNRLHQILEAVRERELVKRRELGSDPITNDTLAFTTGFAEPIDPTTLTKRLGKRLRGAALQPRTFHDLRHGFGSLLAASGKDTFVISRLMGHSGIAVTANVYLRNPSAEMRDAVSALDV